MVVIEESETSFGAYILDLPGCVAVGETGAKIPKPLSKSEYVEILAT